MFRQNQKPGYRKKTLARLSSPERLDEMMKVIKPKNWLILIAFISVITTGIIWSIFGHIPVAIEVKGQSVNGVIELINLPESGRLVELKVNKGDTIQQGQSLATIEILNAEEKNQNQEVLSEFSGRVISIAPSGITLNSGAHFVIIEKKDSSSQKSIFCLSPLTECRNIESGMQVRVIANELQEEFDAKVEKISPLIMFENTSVNFSEKPAIANSLIPQIQSGVIQILGNLKIENDTEDELQKYPSYPVSMRVVKKYSPISFILPNLGSDNESK